MNHMSSTLDKYKWSMTARFTIKEGKYQSLKPIRNFKNQNPVGWKAYYTRIEIVYASRI